MQEMNGQRLDKPLQVKRAVQLFYASYALGIIGTIFRLFYNVSGAAIFFALFIAVTVFGFFIFLVTETGHGKNWARMTLLVLFLLGLPFAIPTYIAELRKAPMSGIMSVTIALIQLVGLYLLFRKESNIWFRARKLSTGNVY